MVIKGQGLMSEQEAQALLDKYDIYLEKYGGATTQLGMEGPAPTNILYYTIDPADYAYLMGNKITNSKPKLFIIMRQIGNTFSFDNMKIEFKVAFPYDVAKRLGFNTRTFQKNVGVSTKVSSKSLKTSGLVIDDSFVDLAREHIEDMAELINADENLDTKNFQIIFMPIQPRGVENPPIKQLLSNQGPTFTVNYNFKPTFDKYTKSRNVKLPDFFSEGFEKYFTETAIKELLPRFRKFIYRRGERDIPHYMNIATNEPLYEDIFIGDLQDEIGEDKLKDLVNKASNIESRTKAVMDEDIKPLDENVFIDMRNTFLDLVGSYFKARGFSRPLNRTKIKSSAIATPIYNMLNTAVVSSLPGFYTPTGQMRGYRFNKSLPERVKKLEKIFKGDYEEIYESMEFGGLLPNAPLSGITARRLFEEETIPSNPQFVLQDFPIDFINTLSIRNMKVDGTVRTNLENFTLYANEKTPLQIFKENNKIIFERDELPSIIRDYYEDDLKLYMRDIVNDDSGKRYAWQDMRSETPSERNFIYSFIVNERTVELTRPIRFDFIFSFDLADGGTRTQKGVEPTSVRLERVEVEYPRRREQSKKFEIDINADDDFYLEICKVINRVLTPRNFQSGSPSYSDRNPTELSNAFLNVLGEFRPDHVVEVKPMLYDSLTGSRRGMWLVVNEGENSLYVTVDERAAGVGSASGKVRGSACMGEFRIISEPAAGEYELEGKKYGFYFSESKCVNLAMPGARNPGGITQDAELGYNADLLYNTYSMLITQGGKLGRPAMTEGMKNLIMGTDAQSLNATNVPFMRQEFSHDSRFGVLYWGEDQPKGEGLVYPDLRGGTMIPLPGLTEFLRTLLEPEYLADRGKSTSLIREYLDGVIGGEVGNQNEDLERKYTDALRAISSYIYQLNINLTQRESGIGMNINFVKKFVAANADRIYENVVRIRLGSDYRTVQFDNYATDEARGEGTRVGRRKRREQFERQQGD